MIQSSLFQFVKDDTPLNPNIILLDNTQWEHCLDELKQAQYCGLDIETYGSQPEHGLNPWKGEIRLIQIGLPSGRTLICDLQTKGFDSPRKRFFEILRDRLRNIICIGTSLKFDALWLRVKYGMIIYRPRCIQLMSKVLWAGIRFMKHSLKEIAERCGIEIDKTEQTWDWGGKLTNKQLNYAHFDSHVPIKCCAKLVEWLREAGCLASAMIECEAMPAFCETEYFGQPVDYAKLQATREAYRIAWNDSIKPFQAAFPGINPNSPKQVASALAAKYGKDFDSTSDDVLSKYQDPALTALLENRSLKTQVDRLDELHTRYFDGSVRGKVQQIAGEEDEAGAGMGRSAYKEPNWQNIGKLQPNWKKLGLPPTRAVVRAPKGYVYLCADLSQAHARIACQVSKDPFLIKAYADDYDVHSDMAFELAKKRDLDWTAKQIKQWAKDKNHPNHSEAKTLRDAAKNCFYGCVPMDTQALTRNGWKKYDELSIGMEILAYDPKTETNRWTPILALNKYENAPIYELNFGTRWKARCTLDHRWYGTMAKRIPGAYKNATGPYHTDEPAICTTADMPRQFRVKVSALAEGGKGLNHDLIPDKYGIDWVQVVLDMTQSERKAFLIGCLISEGHIAKNSDGEGTNWCICQKQNVLGEAMLLAAYMEGYKVTVSTEYGTDMMRMRLAARKVVTGQQQNKTFIENGDVWCPTTEYGTWVMRQGYEITITGNSLNLQAPSTLVRTCSGSAEPIFITEDEAKYLIQLWRQKYAGLYSFQRLRITEAGNKSILPISYKGSVEYGSITGPTGRRLFLAKLPNKYQKGEKTIKGTDCVSFIWMGAEADIIKHAMAEIFYLRDSKWELNFRNMAHDELNLTALEEYAEPASKLVFDCIHKAMKRVISIIPVDEANASPAGLIIDNWSMK